MHSVNGNLPWDEPDGADEQWRREVASRLDRYRARRKKKTPADTTLSFDFEPAPPSPDTESVLAKALAGRRQASDNTGQQGAPGSGSPPFFDTNFYRRLNAEAVFEDAESSAAEPGEELQNVEDEDYDATPAAIALSAEPPALNAEPLDQEPRAADYDPDFDFDRPRAHAAPEASVSAEPKAEPKTEGNLIYFPKPTIRLPVEPPLLEERPYGELAGPVVTAPRIVDVPEAIIPTIVGPLFADIRLDAEKTQEDAAAAAHSAIELPLPVASLSQRLFVGLIDLLIVLTAAIVFCAISWKVLPEVPHGRLAVGALAGSVLFFWMVYHYVMLIYGGRTVGMEIACVSLRGFDGHAPGSSRRRQRVYCMLLSLMSLGLGFAWSMVDEDCLCWHDRMTRTFLVQNPLALKI